jgi:hypothetical protein
LNQNVVALTNPNAALVRSGSATGVSSSANFSHTLTSTSVNITGITNASRTGTTANTTFAYGLGAPNPPTGPSEYGYTLNFNLTTDGIYDLNLGWTRSATTTGNDPSNDAYTDFVAYLWDKNRNIVYTNGGYRDPTLSPTELIACPDLDVLLNNPMYIHPSLGNTLLFLPAGQYQLYLQSQSFVSGRNGTQNASSTANIGITAATPEPVSISLFGGLLAVGGWIAARRKAKAQS